MFNPMRRAGVRLLAIGLACASAQYAYAAACGQMSTNPMTGLQDCVGSNGGSAVLSVYGRTGAIVATSGDYNFSLLGGSLAVGQDYSTAVTPGTYGDATHVGTFTVNAQGRITGASAVPITAGGGGSTLYNQQAPTAGVALPLSTETTIYQTTILAGALGTGNCLDLNLFFHKTGSNTTTWTLAFGTATLPLLSSATTAPAETGILICNTSATAQFYSRKALIANTSVVSPPASGVWAVDTTVNQTLTLTANPGTGTGQFASGDGWIVSLER